MGALPELQREFHSRTDKTFVLLSLEDFLTISSLIGTPSSAEDIYEELNKHAALQPQYQFETASPRQAVEAAIGYIQTQINIGPPPPYVGLGLKNWTYQLMVLSHTLDETRNTIERLEREIIEASNDSTGGIAYVSHGPTISLDAISKRRQRASLIVDLAAQSVEIARLYSINHEGETEPSYPDQRTAQLESLVKTLLLVNLDF